MKEFYDEQAIRAFFEAEGLRVVGTNYRQVPFIGEALVINLHLMDLYNYRGYVAIEQQLGLHFSNYRGEFIDVNAIVIKYVGPGSLEFRFSKLMDDLSELIEVNPLNLASDSSREDLIFKTLNEWKAIAKLADNG